MIHQSSPRRRTLFAAALCFAVCFCLPLPATSATQQTQTQRAQAGQTQTPLQLSWAGRPGVRRYRLQLATDEAFSDIVLDRAVEGRQYTVTELPPGVYYWRVASAAAETSNFSKPLRVTVGATPAAAVVAAPVASGGDAVFRPDDSTGWRTATGEVARLSAARLRQGGVTDFVGVTVSGRVFAVDGANGVSLWNARHEANAPAGFAPVIVNPKAGVANVLAAADGGVRLLGGETGRELWRARLEGSAQSGVVADLGGDAAHELIVVTSGPPMLYALSAETGSIISSAKLEADVVGAPFVSSSAGARGVLLALQNGIVQVRGAGLNTTGAINLGARLTTAPLLVSRGESSVLVVGGEKGLFALGFPELKQLGQIVSNNDPLHGTLAGADVDGDGLTEIVMLTKAGRVALISTKDGAVRWYAEGARGAGMASFADLNGDGVLDVIVPAGTSFALGFSGRDGTLLLRADEPGVRAAEAVRGEPTRHVIVSRSLGGGLMLVGADGAGTGLRAVEIPADAARAVGDRKE